MPAVLRYAKESRAGERELAAAGPSRWEGLAYAHQWLSTRDLGAGLRSPARRRAVL